MKEEKEMFKKVLSVLILGFFCLGGLFAQDGSRSKPNVVTLDTGPIIMGLLLRSGINMVGNMAGDAVSSVGKDLDISGTGFGIGAQYERVLLSWLSATGRFAYMGITAKAEDMSLTMRSFSFEGHGRIYPTRKRLFLDGMAGYANFIMKYSDSDNNLNATAHYFKFGGKLGWKIDFGRPGGLVFEPAFGYYGKLGKAGSAFDKMADDFGGGIAEAKDFLDSYLFVGGPRISLNLGWAF
jgi:hypothetical protein